MELVKYRYYINNKNIPIIRLFYINSIIFIESKCHKGNSEINPLNEFLTLYHPMIKFTTNFKFCIKFLLKFFHYNKQLFIQIFL